MATTPPPIILGAAESPLTLDAVTRVARHHAPVHLAPEARDKVARSRDFIERIAAGDRAVYGVNTGFGELSRIRIEADHLADLQRNLIRSHASGVGEYLPADVTRGMMLLLANSLSRGHSGVRPAVIDRRSRAAGASRARPHR
jgi:histidine ammonia-lyase